MLGCVTLKTSGSLFFFCHSYPDWRFRLEMVVFFRLTWQPYLKDRTQKIYDKKTALQDLLSRTKVCRQDNNQVAYPLNHLENIKETSVILSLSLVDIKKIHPLHWYAFLNVFWSQTTQSPFITRKQIFLSPCSLVCAIFSVAVSKTLSNTTPG